MNRYLTSRKTQNWRFLCKKHFDLVDWKKNRKDALALRSYQKNNNYSNGVEGNI